MNAPNFKIIKSLAARRQTELENIIPRAPDTIYGTVSPFWRGLLGERPNFLAPELFNNFRSQSTSAIYGVGGHKDEDETVRLFEQSVRDIADAQSIPDDVVASLEEPLLGSPTVQQYRGNLFSATFLNNITIGWRIRKIIEHFQHFDRPIKVCEIGAGFGATALALHQLLEIESYTIIDLAENLYLSSIFLPASLPDRTHNLVDPASPQSLKINAQLNFSLPSFADSIDTPEFDLILNRASLGEMPIATARAYVNWVEKHLSSKGIFYFQNRFNVTNAGGANRLSDFGLQNFSILQLLPMERPTRPSNQIHCEIVASTSPSSFQIDSAHLDAIGDLIAVGFDSQIIEIISNVLSNSIDPSLDDALRRIARVFLPSPLQIKYDLLNEPMPDFMYEIKTVLIAAIEIVGGASTNAELRKPEVLSFELGVKLEMRLRGLYAEHEFKHRNADWTTTLAPLKIKSPGLWGMSKLYVSQGKPDFSNTFKRDLRVQ